MEVETSMDERTGGAVSSTEIVDIETLEYTADAALERALALREPLEDAIVSDDLPGPILDELFALIDMARA
jgi:hypothetical protein